MKAGEEERRKRRKTEEDREEQSGVGGSDREGCKERAREGERGNKRERRDRCGYGYVATPRGASQRALRRQTTHLTPQWPDPLAHGALGGCIVPSMAT